MSTPADRLKKAGLPPDINKPVDTDTEYVPHGYSYDRVEGDPSAAPAPMHPAQVDKLRGIRQNIANLSARGRTGSAIAQNRKYNTAQEGLSKDDLKVVNQQSLDEYFADQDNKMKGVKASRRKVNYPTPEKPK